MESAKKILLVDLDDLRRDTRVQLLTQAGYSVEVRNDRIAPESLDHEATFDLVVIALHLHPEAAAAYSDQLSRAKPQLPILLLLDAGVFVPSGTLSGSLEAGSAPKELLKRVAGMLAGSTHIRELG